MFAIYRISIRIMKNSSVKHIAILPNALIVIFSALPFFFSDMDLRNIVNISLFYVLAIIATFVFFPFLDSLTGAKWGNDYKELYSSMASFIYIMFIPSLLIAVQYIANEGVFGGHSCFSESASFKELYLSPYFLLIRLMLYELVWILMYHSSKAYYLPGRQINKSGVYVFLYASAFSFFSIDIFHLYEATFFNTIFPFYFFSGIYISVLSITALSSILDKRNNQSGLHSLGKMIFGFNIFHAYMLFCMILILWYGNLPEEAFFLNARISGDREIVTSIIIAVEFVIPFLLLIPANAKKNKLAIFISSIFITIGFYFEILWILAPQVLKTDNIIYLLISFLSVVIIIISASKSKFNKN